MDSVTRFFASVFVHESVSPSLRVSQYNHFEFCRKFAEIFASQGAPPVSTKLVANLPPVSTTPAANLATIFASVVDTGSNLPPGCQQHRWQIATGINNTGGKLPQV
jgi:hypothetical protein